MRWVGRGAVLLGSLGALSALAVTPACGGHAVASLYDAPDASTTLDASAGDARAGAASRGTAVVQNGGAPTDFTHAYAMLATPPNAVVLMLFLTDRPRTCSEHLAGIDYVGERDIYYSVMWFPREAGPVAGTWHFSSAGDGKPREPATPKIESWFLEHRKCGAPATVWGSPSVPNDVNYLTLDAVSPARVSGTFITQMAFSTAGWEGPRGLYLHGSFDTVPCVVPNLYPPDPGAQWATLPSKTCP